MDVLADVLERLHLSGTVLYHYELGRPWSLAVPRFPDAVFHYLSRGDAVVALDDGAKGEMRAGDFVLITRGEPHVLCSDNTAKPVPLLDLGRRPAHLGIVRHGGTGKPASTMICGYFRLSRPTRGGLLDVLPRILHLRADDHRWLETILQRLVAESAIYSAGQHASLSRMTEVLFIEVVRSWMKSLGPKEGGWLGAIADPHIGKALQLIHEEPERAWTLSELGRRVGLGRSAFSARFTRLVGQPVHAYLVARRMEQAALVLASESEAISQVAARVGYHTASAFSKAFGRHHGLSPGRYRAAQKNHSGGPERRAFLATSPP